AALRESDGLGDITIGPLLQFSPIVDKEGPVFSQRFELDFNIPTGKVRRNDAISPGVNFFSFNPYWAATYWFTNNWTVSWPMHYLWNGRSDKPSNALRMDPNVLRRIGGDDVDTVQPGQALHANFATEYAITPQLRLGLNGYWFKQIEDTEVEGKDIPG